MIKKKLLITVLALFVLFNVVCQVSNPEEKLIELAKKNMNKR